ncbi:MAG: GNAT family N-acetyltransferase, partial [Dokdonella sp.]
VTCEWSDWRNGNWWWLQSVYVIPPARRSGVFRALYRDTERNARETEGVVGLRLYVEKENRIATRTYVSLGMRDSGYKLLQAGWVEAKLQTGDGNS